MILYAVEPPRFEDQGEGEDTREWFGTLAKAARRYHELVAEAKQYRDAFSKAWQIADLDSRGAAMADAEELNPGWAFWHVTLDKYDIPTIKHGLIKALNCNLRGYSTTVEEWRE